MWRKFPFGAKLRGGKNSIMTDEGLTMNDDTVEGFSCQELVTWMRNQSELKAFRGIFDFFEKEDVTGADFVDMTKQDFVDHGFTDFTTRRFLQRFNQVVCNDMYIALRRVMIARGHSESIDFYKLISKSERHNVIQEALSGSVVVQDFLAGFAYAKGFGVTQDHEKAFLLFQKGVKAGYSPAQNDMAILYSNGTGVEKDEKKAFELYRLAADQGNISAKSNLAPLYINGTGVDKDPQKGIEMYQQLVDHGYLNFNHKLGHCYYYGFEVEKDYTKAMKYFQLGHEAGVVLSTYHLAKCYHFGNGVPKDKAKALEWYKKAAEKGHPKAKAKVKKLTK